MNVYNVDKEFDYDGLSLANPGRLQGGAYYSKIKHNDTALYVQSPKCTTKNGVVVTGKKTYCDLMFTTNEQSMINWIIDFEKKVKDMLFTKSSLWFNNPLDIDDIEYFFNSSLRTYKGNKQLMRTYIHTTRNNPLASVIQVYDENETIRQSDEIIDASIIAIVYLKGLKFTQNSFQLDIELKQVMLLDDIPEFSTCMIKRATQINSALSPKPTSPIHMDSHSDASKSPCALTDDISSIDSELTMDTSTNIVMIPVPLTNICDSSNVILSSTDTSIPDSPSLQDLEKTECNLTELSTSDDSEVESLPSDTNDNVSVIEQEQVNTDESNEITSDKKECLDISHNSIEKSNYLEEVELKVDDSEPISLKQPNEVFYEIYKEARRKAKLARKAAIIAYLEAKKIKNTYMLDELDSGSDDDLDNLSTMSDEGLQEQL